MKLVRGASLRGLIPALAVATVLGISFIALPSSPFGDSVAVGYGYGYGGNNCGVKGNGTHDHGKACPNRPFPGHGNGVVKKGVTSGAATTQESQSGANGATG